MRDVTSCGDFCAETHGRVSVRQKNSMDPIWPLRGATLPPCNVAWRVLMVRVPSS